MIIDKKKHYKGLMGRSGDIVFNGEFGHVNKIRVPYCRAINGASTYRKGEAKSIKANVDFEDNSSVLKQFYGTENINEVMRRFSRQLQRRVNKMNRARATDIEITDGKIDGAINLDEIKNNLKTMKDLNFLIIL